jgi:phosphoglycolate phosphatase-like HAD superfamily hydrolase
LHAAHVHDLVELASSSSEAERSKPDPDIVVAAAQKAGLPREMLVLIGDTPYDIEAAGRAGIRAVAFRCGGWDDAHLGGAVAVYDGPGDLLRNYDESPFGRARHRAS